MVRYKQMECTPCRARKDQKFETWHDMTSGLRVPRKGRVVLAHVLRILFKSDHEEDLEDTRFWYTSGKLCACIRVVFDVGGSSMPSVAVRRVCVMQMLDRRAGAL